MESRAIFWACVFITFVNGWLAFDRTYEAVLAKRVVDPSPFDILDGTYRVWGFLFSLLGAGCLLWERRQGGSAFSLGLPVRPAYFNLIRGGVGFAQVAFISSLPCMLAGWIHALIRPELPFVIIPAFTSAGIALGFGSFSVAYLVSAFIRNLYISIGVGWVAAVAFSASMANLPFTESLAGMPILRKLGSLPAQPIEWGPVCAYTTLGSLFVTVGAYISEHRSYQEMQ